MESKIRERSKPPLHNFTMPANLRWGNQRFLRCMKVNSDAQSDRRPESSSSSDEDGIAAMREKVMIDLQNAADKMKDAIFKEGGGGRELRASPKPKPTPTVSWNLRTRRAASKTPLRIGNDGAGDLKVDAPARPPIVVEKSPRLRKKEERPKFSVSLSKKEIEEDFLAMLGHRPPRRPKKRPKTLQKELDPLFPGFWLTEVTPDKYKVTETAPS